MKEINENGEVVVKKTGKGMKIFLVLLVVLLAGGGFAYYKYTQTEGFKLKAAEAATKSLVSKVGKLMVVPEGTPSIFTVEDPSLLTAQQAFFNGTEKGDTLLVYAEVGKAIIYSEKRNIIVNVGPVTFDQDTAKNGAKNQ